MHILLTGGTGFVGKALVGRLRSQGTRLTLLTRRSVADKEAVVLVAGNWTQAALATAIREARPDAIVHLAGVSRASSVEALYEANVFLAERLMAAAAECAPRVRILLTGSAAEYGLPLTPTGLATESDPPRPISAYGISKLAQTQHALARASAGAPITIARLFNPVGPHMPLGLAFADVARQLAAGGDTLATGDIDAERDFMSVDEAARIIHELLLSPAAEGKLVNICSGVAQPVRRGVERLIAAGGRQVTLLRQSTSNRSSEVKSIRGSTHQLEALDIEPASAEIGPALDALMEQAKRG